MTEIFLKLLNMSIATSWVVLAVLILRFFLKKSPKRFSCLLWGIVGLRLMLPFHLESALSLIPSAQVIPENIVTTQTPAIYSGIPSVNSAINPLLTLQTGDTLETLLFAASAVWFAGMVIMLLYSAVAYLKLRWQVRASVVYQQNIYVCDNVQTPFILGVFCPKIYVPSGLTEEQLRYILAHENAHICRRDHWWKPLGFLVLAVYWFNPLLWLSYILLCRDIEQSCDEKVIDELDGSEKKRYLQTLIDCSAQRRMVMVCPVAFGEIGVKERVNSILSYKKPGFWILLASVSVCIVTAVCFLTNPKPCAHEYQSEVMKSPTCIGEGMQKHTCQLCGHSYTTAIPVLAHTYDEGTVTKASTCVQTGIKELTCTGCGAKKTEVVEKTPHTGGEPILTKEPNCTQKGEMSATCTVCQAAYTVEILETNDVHELTETVVSAATCAAPGEGIRKCTRCDYSEACVYPLLEHTYQVGEIFESTCRIPGLKQHICTACGHQTWTELPLSTEHRWTDMGAYFPDVCMECGKSRPGTSRESNDESEWWYPQGSIYYDPSFYIEIWPDSIKMQRSV